FLLDKNEYPLARQIAGLESAVIVLHGTADEIVPTEQSVAVALAAPNLVREIAIEGARHNDAIWQGAQVADAVAEVGDQIRAQG
ncbi:MAG: alpha/beta hydrolase, partial [Promicromonosporaceae bacterium]|nr:alpha/beta hydrolase [Promicromonosporaceae bacterium]